MDQFKPAVKEAFTSLETMIRAIEIFNKALKQYQNEATVEQKAAPVKPVKKTKRKKAAAKKKDQPLTKMEKAHRTIGCSFIGVGLNRYVDIFYTVNFCSLISDVHK